MEPEARFAHFNELAATIPDFGDVGTPNQSPEVHEWLGRLHALLDQDVFGSEAFSVRLASDGVGTILHDNKVRQIVGALYRAIARDELLLPASRQGSFIAAGNAYDALTATTRILSEAKSSLLIVDPYLGPKVLEVYAVQANEGVRVELLGSSGQVHAGLEPAAKAWAVQFGNKRPLSLRHAPRKQLHDRLIVVDRLEAWDVSQSFKDLAARSPASLSKALAEQAALKIEAYVEMYENAAVVI